MREKKPGADLVRDRAQVRIVPCGQDIAIGSGRIALGIPAHPETIAVGRDVTETRVQALVYQRILGFEYHPVEVDRIAAISQPSAHALQPPRSN
ncbi:MAG: hypothetical protein IPH83_15825 [Gammaproteobacteria bacterium]|nr:hypothetical protein [Gammaproteobacteria bacterium]